MSNAANVAAKMPVVEVTVAEVLSKDRFDLVVVKAQEALANNPGESFAAIKTRVLRGCTRYPEYALIKDAQTLESIVRSANNNRYHELVAIAFALVNKHEGDKNGSFFELIKKETLAVCQDDDDFGRVKELIGAVVGTALAKKKEMNDESRKQAENDKQFNIAGQVVADFAATNPVRILGNPSLLATEILDQTKALTTQGKIRLQLIRTVDGFSTLDKLNILYTTATEAVEGYFTANPKELFRKGETDAQLKQLCEKVRCSSEQLSQVMTRHEVFVVLARSIMEKREMVASTFRQQQKNDLLATGLSLMQKKGVKNPGSARRRHAVRFPDGNKVSEKNPGKKRK